MRRKHALIFLVAVLLVVGINFSVSGASNSLVFASSQQDCVVDKAATISQQKSRSRTLEKPKDFGA